MRARRFLTGVPILAACEQERVTRVRGAGLNPSGLPDETVDLLLNRGDLRRAQIERVAVGEPVDIAFDGDLVRFDHHRSHAAASYLTSPFQRAVVVVCDHQSPEVSVWDGNGADLTPVERPWRGAGPATLYSRCADVLGLGAQDSHLEALSRLQPEARDSRLDGLFRFADDSIELAPDWTAKLAATGTASAISADQAERAAPVAAAVQNLIGDLLLELLSSVRRQTGVGDLCLAGSLFYNTRYCALAKTSGLFERVFVPVNPGNAGLAVGTALHANGAAPHLTSPFLGPAFDSEEIKATLDNCKLTYEWVGEPAAIARAVDALTHGSLVGWFNGAMEWGPRALGARCILASPFSPYVLENLNRFLKHRKPWRGYALTGLDADIRELFAGPSESPFMECDYAPRDRELFRHVVPHPKAAIRVQTVGASAPRQIQDLLRAFGQASGRPVLVNTSFNGFSEPIVCSPRDAVRVFYGTGLDLLVMNDFVLRK